MKRLSTLLLAVTMVLGSAVGAMAEDTNPEHSTTQETVEITASTPVAPVEETETPVANESNNEGDIVDLEKTEEVTEKLTEKDSNQSEESAQGTLTDSEKESNNEKVNSSEDSVKEVEEVSSSDNNAKSEVSVEATIVDTNKSGEIISNSLPEIKVTQNVASLMSVDDSTVQLTEDTPMPLQSGNYVVSGNVELSALTFATGAVVTIDLQQGKLTIPAATVLIKDQTKVTFKNGEIVSKDGLTGIQSLFNVETKSSITLDTVTLKTTGAALFPRGDAAEVNVLNSNISAGTYAVGTNANGPENYGVVINLKNSTFKTSGFQNNDGDDATVMINVPGTLNIDSCEITGNRISLFVRGGKVNVKNSTITNTGLFEPSESQKEYGQNGKDWGSQGNEAPMGAVVLGNDSKTAYNKGESSLTIENTTVVSQTEGVPAIYTQDKIPDDESTRNLSISGNSEVKGEFTSMDDGVKEDLQSGTYTDDVTDLLPDETLGIMDSEGKFYVGPTAKSYVEENPGATIVMKNGDSINVPQGTVVDNQTGNEIKVNNQIVPSGLTIEDGFALIYSVEDLDQALNAGYKNIRLMKNITINKHYGLSGDVTFDGNGKSVTTTDTSTTGDTTIFTIADGTLTIYDVELVNSPKYGLQAYKENGKIVATNVKITNPGYGGVLINGGKAKLNNVIVNGDKPAVELGKGSGVESNPSLDPTSTIGGDNNGLYVDNLQFDTEDPAYEEMISDLSDVAKKNGIALTDRDSTIVAEPSAPVEQPKEEEKKTPATYDDGGPFTTDANGNVFDRWGNEIWHNPVQSTTGTTGGFQLVNTSDR